MKEQGDLFRPRGQELNTEHAQIRTLLDRQKEQILAECQAEIKKHEFQADYDRRSVRKLQKGCYWNSLKADVQFFRATTPLSRGQLKSKGHGKLSIHYASDLETVETIFRIIVSANQLSLYGAVAERDVKNMNPFTRERCDPL